MLHGVVTVFVVIILLGNSIFRHFQGLQLNNILNILQNLRYNIRVYPWIHQHSIKEGIHEIMFHSNHVAFHAINFTQRLTSFWGLLFRLGSDYPILRPLDLDSCNYNYFSQGVFYVISRNFNCEEISLIRNSKLLSSAEHKFHFSRMVM